MSDTDYYGNSTGRYAHRVARVEWDHEAYTQRGRNCWRFTVYNRDGSVRKTALVLTEQGAKRQAKAAINSTQFRWIRLANRVWELRVVKFLSDTVN